MLWCALTELIGGLTSQRALCLPGLIFSLFVLYQPERQKHLTDAPQTCIVFPNIFMLWYSNPAQNLTTSSILNIKYLLPAEEVVCFPLTSELSVHTRKQCQICSSVTSNYRSLSSLFFHTVTLSLTRHKKNLPLLWEGLSQVHCQKNKKMMCKSPNVFTIVYK